MSFQYAGQAFEGSRPLHTLVLVGMRGDAEGPGASVAHVVAHCRAALNHARRNGLPVCFVHDARGGRAPKSGWIEGLTPTRYDRLVIRRGRSCFDSPYFAEAASGTLALAGFLERDALIATARDAIRQARPIIFLEDAIVAPTDSIGFAREFLKPARAEIQSCRTQCWIETTNQYGKA